jgi:hypothetical protein
MVDEKLCTSQEVPPQRSANPRELEVEQGYLKLFYKGISISWEPSFLCPTSFS